MKLATKLHKAVTQLTEAGIITGCKYEITGDTTASLRISATGITVKFYPIIDFAKIRTTKEIKQKIIEAKHWLTEQSECITR